MIWITLGIAALLVVGAYFLFRNTMNVLQSIGPLYWATRDNGIPDVPHVAWAFMRGTSPPWKIGNGIQFRAGKYTFQMGLCHNGPQFEDEYDGLLHMLQSNDPDVVDPLPVYPGTIPPSAWNK